MITKEINENRKLISAFMGYEFADIGYFDDEDETEWQRKNQDWMKQNDLEDIGEYFVNIKENKWHEFDDAIYHLSFDWLMPVVDKIELLILDIGVKNKWHVHPVVRWGNFQWSKVNPYWSYFEVLNENDQVVFLIHEYGNTRIESVYSAVIKFIKWYNIYLKNQLK